MSGILRNTLRLVGTAKYATNNSTKYLRSMTVTTNRLNHSLQFPGPLTNFWTTIRAAGKKILSPIDNDIIIQTSKIGAFEVSLSNSNLRFMMSNSKPRSLILPPIFRTELNGKSIKPESNENIEESDIKKRSLKFWDWDLLLHGAELKLKLNNSGKVFILKHEIHVKAFENPPAQVEGGSKRIAPKLDRFRSSYLKIILKRKESKPVERIYVPVLYNMTPKLYLKHDLVESSTEESEEEIPNSDGRMKLQFPMTVLLEGAPQKMKIKDSDDYFTIDHTVTIEAMDVEKKKSLEPSKPKDILRMTLSSGDIKIKIAESAKQTAIFRQEVDIEIDLINKIPSILVFPSVKAIVYE